MNHSFLAQESEIYYATCCEGVRVFSPQNSGGTSVVTSSEHLLGVAYDTLRNKIYWSSIPKIYRTDPNDPSNVEPVFNTSQCKLSNNSAGLMPQLERSLLEKSVQTVNFEGWLLTGSVETSTLRDVMATYWRVMAA